MTENDYLIGPNKKPSQEIEVTASNTLSKYSTLEVDDYELEGYYDDGQPCLDFKNCNLNKNWKDNKYTAKEALDLAVEFAKKIYILSEKDLKEQLNELHSAAAKVFNACEGWEEDEFEVVY